MTKAYANIDTAQAPAERLPFEDGRFDFLGTLPLFRASLARELGGRPARGAPGAEARQPGHINNIDPYSPGPALFDTHLQSVELLRDTSHVRNYTAGGMDRRTGAVRSRACRVPDVAAAHGLSRLRQASACARRTTMCGRSGRCRRPPGGNQGAFRDRGGWFVPARHSDDGDDGGGA